MIDGADLAACRELLANGSRTFLAASWFLPRRVRDAASALYAFCRLADDAVDANGSAAAGVAAMRARLAALYAGRPFDCAADRAFAAVVRDHAIDRTLPEALIEGFAWDAEGRRYETIDDLHDYAARVAGSVGAMMAVLMGVRDSDALARACDLGVAMQLSNIARDVGEDARMGRIYLPLAWMRDAGLDPSAWLAAPAHDASLALVVRRLLDEADRLYERVDSGIARLPMACRPGINTARRLYAAIGHEVARGGLDAVSRRAVVPRRRKLVLLMGSTIGAFAARGGARESALPATRYLVEAAASTAVRIVSGPRWWNLHERAVWTIELIERLERHDRNAIA